MSTIQVASEFLAREAKLLDERRFEEWYALLDEDLEYVVPTRIAKLNYDDEFPEGGFRIADCKAHIRTRIDRLDSDHAWAEIPPSRTLRVVGSIFVEETENSDVIVVESAMILYRQRGHDDEGDVIPVRRTDHLRLTEMGPRLLKRRAVLTTVSLKTPNLGVFL